MKKALIENEEKMTDEAFLRSLITSVISILLCIVALCSMTYAWFAEDVAAENNSIVAGSFDLDITVTDAALTEMAVSDAPKVCTLMVPGTYTVCIKMSAEATASKGYCILRVNGEAYRTAPVYRDGTTSLTFTIVTQEIGTKVTFEPVWGLSAHEDVTQDSTIQVKPMQGANE